MNIDEFTMGKSFRIAFSNRTFYPYILLFHLMLVLIDRLSAIKSLNSLQLLSILTVVFLTLISGRRAPLICEIFVIFIVFIKSKKRLYSVFSILILLIIILSIDFSGYATVERLSLLSLEDGKINEGPYSNSVGSRLELLSIFWSFWCQRPLFGWGLLGYEQLLALKSPVYAGYSPHNTFLGVLVEYGLIGLVVALRGLFKVVFIRKPFRVFNYVLLVIIAINIVEYNTIPSQIFFIPTLILPLLIYGLSKKV
jgi:O-antigen ligase